MSTAFPGQPKTLRGAIVGIDFLSLQPVDVISFQYNPHTLVRAFEVKAGVSGAEAGQIGGAPAESIKVELELDATDDLEEGRGAMGVAPRLAALENLVTPSSGVTIANLVLLNVGTIEIVPPTAMVTLFIWGPQRVMPIVVSELSVTEEQHDVNLSPTVARVSLGMRVLNWDDVGQFHPAFGIAMSHQLRKEALANLGPVPALQSALGVPSLSL